MEIIWLEEQNCKGCYKCIRNCPVKAIKFVDGKSRIIENDCILCGKCTAACPQNAKRPFSDLEIIKRMIGNNRKIYASIAPSYISSFPNASLSKMSSALKKLGFTSVEETAIGASEVITEYMRLINEGKMKNIFTSCCPTVNLIVQKCFPELLGQLAPVVAPATAHARIIKSTYGNRAKVVFIGPCISKKHEALLGHDINAVLLFDELKQWLSDEGVRIGEKDVKPSEMHNTISRLCALPGGIIDTLPLTGTEKYKFTHIEGTDRCFEIFKSIRDNDISGHFIELSACCDSCMSGFGAAESRQPFLTAKSAITNLSSRKTKTPLPLTENTNVPLDCKFDRTKSKAAIPNEEAINSILEEIGRNKEQAIHNCGACGYKTCRDNAIAVYRGEANKRMCLPYLREKEEAMANLILDYTPNAKIDAMRSEIIDATQKVIEKQMRAAQEIAGLLGESAGETKAVLTKLKKSILSGDGE